jgi:endoglucanase
MRYLPALSLALMLSVPISSPAQAPDKNPPRLTTQGRLDLMADAAVGRLSAGQLVRGGGTVTRMNWVAPAEQPRGYTAQLPLTHLGWSKFALRFTPAKSGTVRLVLMGPWEEARKGLIYKQEVLWDDLRAEGAILSGGGFEAGGKVPAGWESQGGKVVAATARVPAVEGNHYARTWHNGTLSTTLKVTGGKPVTLTGSVRAALPDGFQEMRPVAGRDTPAHRAAKRFRRGANLGNYLEAPPGQDWGARYTAEDFKHIQQEGFDHVRLPVAWHHYTGPGPEFKLGPAIFAKVDPLVNWAKERGLNVILNIHHFDAFTSDPKKHRDKFLALWRQIAAHYAKAPDGVAFELLNEPRDAATTAALNPIYAEAIRLIRKTNPQRTLFVGPGKWNQVGELAHLRLPEDDHNLIVTVHSYDPFYFTHQGASWAGADVKVTGIRYPGPPEKPLTPPAGLKLNTWVKDWLERYNTLPAGQNPCGPRAFRGAVRLAKQWSDYYGRPVHVGEFGCYVKADAPSRARYLKDCRQALDEAGLGWALWDWKAGFRYWDSQQNRPEPGLREALFPGRK